MFKSQNFCHIASNNRNQVKVGVFVYRTTDDLQTVLTNGYFNERIIDINLHDLIIHEKIDNADNTKVIRNVLCVTERTLENVGTSLIKSDWENGVDLSIADLYYKIEHLDLSDYVKKDGSTIMTAPLKFSAGSMRGAVGPYLNGVSFWKLDSQGNITNIANLTDSQFTPVTTNSINLGNATHTWKDAYISRVITAVINNGYDITVPVTNGADTLALKSEVDLAANSGRMITDKGVWYAKMYAATVAPSAENGTNYADFSQTDGQGNPIIVIYNRVNGAWVQDQTITPPAEYDGYVSVTSKIWDIVEQAGQQGGKVLWSHNQKTFTPYPQIISFDSPNITNSTITNATITGSTFSGSAALSGTSEVELPATPTDEQIVNKKYVDDAISSSSSSIPKFFWDYTWVNDEATWESSFWTIKNPITVGSVLRDGYLGSSAEATVASVNGNSAAVSVRAILFRDPDGDYSGNYSWGAPNFIQVYTTTATPSTSSTWTNTPTSGQGDFSFSGTVISVDPNNSYIVIEFTGLSIGKSSTESEISTDSHIVIDFQEPSADNNYTWYRLYNDNWVEQGGFVARDTAEQNTIIFIIAMADTNYSVSVTGDWTGKLGYAPTVNKASATTTGISLTKDGTGMGLWWQITGKAKG